MATRFWQEWEVGQRVSVRYRVEGGFSDALGYIRRIDADGMDVETRRGLITVPADLIVVGKRVPPPPARCSRPAPPQEPWPAPPTAPDERGKRP